MKTKEEILEKHLKTMINQSNQSYSDISEMKEQPEWEVTINAMQEYANANTQREILISFCVSLNRYDIEDLARSRNSIIVDKFLNSL